MSDEDWQRAVAIIADNRLKQARTQLLQTLKNKTKPDVEYIFFKYGGRSWRIDRVTKGDEVPEWATGGWSLINEDSRSKSASTLTELAGAWEEHFDINGFDENDVPGWTLTSYHHSSRTCAIIVFAEHIDE